jgi:hypothetical protein
MAAVLAHNVTKRFGGLGNPLAFHRRTDHKLTSWEHVRVFAWRGLLELHEAHGLAVERALAAGDYPLLSWVGRWDPRRAAFLTVTVRKKAAQ